MSLIKLNRADSTWLVRANLAALNKRNLHDLVVAGDDVPEYSDFLKFKTQAAEVNTPILGYLRVELHRQRPGMNDFLLRAATPAKDGADPSSLVTLRVHKSLANPDGCTRVATVLRDQMVNLKDTTHTWDNLDLAHLAKMLMNKLRFFAQNPDSEKLQFTTEALR